MTTPDPSADVSTAPSAEILKKENEELRAALQSYKNLEEQLMGQRVVELAKKRLMVWLTIGGFGTAVLGVVGYKQIEDVAKKKVDDIAEQRISDLIQRHVSDAVTAKDRYINAQITESVGK